MFLPNVYKQKIKSKRKRKLETIYETQIYISSDEECINNVKRELNRASCHYDYKPEYDFVVQKVNGKNIRTVINERRGDLLCFTNLLDFESSKKCKHMWVFDLECGEYICNLCLQIDTKIENCDEEFNNPNSNMRIWNREHDRNRWTREDLEYCKGHFNHLVPDQLWLSLLREVPEKFTWYFVFKIFQKNDLKKLWMGFGAFIGFNMKISPQIIKNADNFTDYKMCDNYRIPYIYLVYKFTQLYGEKGDEEKVPLKASKSWLEKADSWWKEVCEEQGIKFIKSKIHFIIWNKREQLEKFSKCLKQMGLGIYI